MEFETMLCPKILVVEDDDIDFKLFQRTIQARKIANPIERAFDGQEGIEKLEVMRKSGPAIVLLDLNTPRMNGHEFLEVLRAHPTLSKTVVFVFTTSEDEEDIKKGFEKNIAGYFLKDNADESIEKVVEVLNAYWQIAVIP